MRSSENWGVEVTDFDVCNWHPLNTTTNFRNGCSCVQCRSGQPPWNEASFLAGSLCTLCALCYFIWLSLESQNSVTRKFWRKVILHTGKLGNLSSIAQPKKWVFALSESPPFPPTFFLLGDGRWFSLEEGRECWHCHATLLLFGSGIIPTKRFLQL